MRAGARHSRSFGQLGAAAAATRAFINMPKKWGKEEEEDVGDASRVAAKFSEAED